MNNTTHEAGVKTLLTIHDLLTIQPYIPLSEAAIREVGPAAQTLGGLYRITGSETFVEIEEIARKARLPKATCKHQLRRLHEAGWIDNRGRQCTRRGFLRRTATHALTKKAKTLKAPFLRLPYWATGVCWWGRMTWKARVIFAVISSRYNILRETEAIAEYVDEDGELLLEEFEDRFYFSLSDLQKQTGLDHKSITGAKRELYRARLIDWRGERDGMATDLIAPNANLSIVRTDFNSTNRFRLDLAK